MTVASDIARDHYLTLALFSRRIIEALREFAKSGKRTRLKAALPAAIESLQATTSARHPTGYGIRVRRRYDQVRTITELFPDEARAEMIKKLRALESDGTSEAQRQAANEAAHFFYAIENRALRNYRHPAPQSSRAATAK
jgi:hypothetical protein